MTILTILTFLCHGESENEKEADDQGWGLHFSEVFERLTITMKDDTDENKVKVETQESFSFNLALNS